MSAFIETVDFPNVVSLKTYSLGIPKLPPPVLRLTKADFSSTCDFHTNEPGRALLEVFHAEFFLCIRCLKSLEEQLREIF